MLRQVALPEGVSVTVRPGDNTGDFIIEIEYPVSMSDQIEPLAHQMLDGWFEEMQEVVVSHVA